MDDRSVRGTATITAATVVAGDAAFVVFAVAGEPWGSVNDLFGAAAGVATAALVTRSVTGSSGKAQAVAWIGAGVSVIGAGLVLTRTTGWLLAGFVSTAGWGLLGSGIVSASRRLEASDRISARVGRFGRWTGWLMALGLTAVVPAALRIDDPGSAPGWSWLPFVGSAATFVLLPAWAIGVARSQGAVAKIDLAAAADRA